MDKMLDRLKVLSKKQDRVQDENDEILYILNILEKKKQTSQLKNNQDQNFHQLLTQQKDKEYLKQIQENTTMIYKYQQLTTFITTQETSKLQYLLSKLILQPQNANQYYIQLKCLLNENIVLPQNLQSMIEPTNITATQPIKNSEDVLQYVEEIQQLNQQIKKQNQEIQKLKDQNQKLQQNAHQQASNITLPKAALSQMITEYQKLKVEIQNIKKQLQQMKPQIDDEVIYNLFQKYIFMSDQNAQAQSIQHSDQLVKKQLEIDKLMQQNKLTQNNIKQLESQIQQAQQDKNETDQISQKLKDENKQLNLQISQLQLVNDKMQQQINELSKDVTKAQQSKKEQQQQDQQDKANTLAKDKQLNDLQSQIDYLQSQLKLKEQDLQLLLSKNQTLEESKNDIQNTAKQTKDELNAEISQLREKLKQKESAVPNISQTQSQYNKKQIILQLSQFQEDLQACYEHLLSAKKQQQLKLLNITRSVDQKFREIGEIFENIIKKLPQNDLELQQYKKDLQESHIQLQEKNQDIQNLTDKIDELRKQLLEQPKQTILDSREAFDFNFYTQDQPPKYNDVFISVKQLEDTRFTAIKRLKQSHLLQKDAGTQVLRVFGLIDQIFTQNVIAVDFGFVTDKKYKGAAAKTQKKVQLNFLRANFDAAMRCYVDTKIEQISENCVGVFPLLNDQNLGLHISLIGIIFYLVIDGWYISSGAKVHQGKTMVFPLLQKDQNNQKLTLNALQSLDNELVD